MKMAEEYLSDGGLYLHEYSRGLRLLHPDHHSITYEVIRQCDQYLKEAYDFLETGQETLKRFEAVRDRLERERVGAVLKRNQLQMEETGRVTAAKSLRALIQAKKDRLERLTRHYESLRHLAAADN